ncbi:retrovirus-related pol polyprotein from transposon TNT 1-94, partial [Tanacetum coccineum]
VFKESLMYKDTLKVVGAADFEKKVEFEAKLQGSFALKDTLLLYVYFKVVEFAPSMYIYLLLYVDEMLIACKCKFEIKYTKGLLRKEFDMKELGLAIKIISMEIVRDMGSRTLKVS